MNTEIRAHCKYNGTWLTRPASPNPAHPRRPVATAAPTPPAVGPACSAPTALPQPISESSKSSLQLQLLHQQRLPLRRQRHPAAALRGQAPPEPQLFRRSEGPATSRVRGIPGRAEPVHASNQTREGPSASPTSLGEGVGLCKVKSRRVNQVHSHRGSSRRRSRQPGTARASAPLGVKGECPSPARQQAALGRPGTSASSRHEAPIHRPRNQSPTRNAHKQETPASEDSVGGAQTPQSPGGCAPRPPSPVTTSPEEPGPTRASPGPGPGTSPPCDPGPAEARHDPARAGPGGPPTRTTKGGAGVKQMRAAAEGLKKSACTKFLRPSKKISEHGK